MLQKFVCKATPPVADMALVHNNILYRAPPLEIEDVDADLCSFCYCSKTCV